VLSFSLCYSYTRSLPFPATRQLLPFSPTKSNVLASNQSTRSQPGRLAFWLLIIILSSSTACQWTIYNSCHYKCQNESCASSAMAPWTSRILSPNSHNNSNYEASPTAGPSSAGGLNSASPVKVRPRITEADILENAYGIPTLQAPTGRNGKKNSHGRYVPRCILQLLEFYRTSICLTII